MICPEQYEKNIENLSLELLINQRNNLMRSIKRYERGKTNNETMMTNPSPDIVYFYELQYLEVIIKKNIQQLESKSFD